MLFFYNLAIWLYSLAAWLLSPFNEKARRWVNGRKGWLNRVALTVDAGTPCWWFHFPSLGEFEQGRPVLEELKKRRPDKKIIITFFSPSGYTVRKDYAGADHVFYLPPDTKKNARDLIRLINPEMAIFTKYDYWFHYFKELYGRDTPLYVISAIFSSRQPFFKCYGSLHRELLGYITRIFVQDDPSKALLRSIGITNVTVSGDTRFDRVVQHAAHAERIMPVEQFTGSSLVFIAGSTWEKDEELIGELMKDHPLWKFILAPHETGQQRLKEITGRFPGITPYSEWTSKPGALIPAPGQQALLIDSVGLLSSLYQYGSVAYLGGGFGSGIHNILEAAAFDLPVVFGPNYGRFKEANDLIGLKAAFSCRDLSGLKQIMKKLELEEERKAAGKAAGQYVQEHAGATAAIVEYLSGSQLL